MIIFHFTASVAPHDHITNPSATAAALLLITLLFFFLLHRQRIRRRHAYNLPPSPSKLPILGNLHQLLLGGGGIHRSLQSLSLQHGPLMMLHLGLSPTVVASSRDAAEEIMKAQDQAFSNRPPSYMADRLLYGGKDIAFAPYGEYWRQAKKMVMVELLSSKRVDSFRHTREEVIKIMMEKVAGSEAVVNLNELVTSVSNEIVCRVALGRKFEEGHVGEACGGWKETIREFAELLGCFYVGDYIPFLAWVGRLSGLNGRAEKNSREWDQLLEGILKEHEADRWKEEEDGIDRRRRGRQVEDFVDVLLRHVRVAEDDESDRTSGVGIFNRDHIKAIILDVFAAGTDTTSTTIEWTMAEILRDSRVMKKVQEEVRAVAGGSKMVTEEKLHQLKFLKLVIKESMRLHPPVPLLVPRETTRHCKVHGYDVPAKTRVIVNAWAIGRDPSSWEEPERFLPERFADGGANSHVDFRGNDFEFIPFGAGRRMCPGISFAMPAVELTLANLLNGFDWKVAGWGVVDMEESHGLTARKKEPLLLIPSPRLGLQSH